MFLFLWVALPAMASDVTPQNWKTHPEIMEVRVLRKTVESRAAQPSWTNKKKDLQTCAGQTTVSRSVLLDDRKTIRRFKSQGIDNGIASWTTQYYNEDGKLRFVHLRLTHEETQSTADYTLFLDVHGDRLFEHLQRTTDEQKRLPSSLPESFLVSRPKKTFGAPSACGSR